MDDLTRNAASEILEKEPELAKTLEEFSAAQQELVRFFDLMGVRQTAVEMPPAGNAEATLHANVSGLNR